MTIENQSNGVSPLELIEGIKSFREVILKDLDVGDPAGEDDRLLEDCQIDTLAFTDLFSDKKDLIVGPKGSGKSSLYMIFTKYLRGLMLKTRRIIVIKGVAKVGGPIYSDYSADFASFRYQDFQNFWNLLFINLIYREFILDKDVFDPTQIETFRALCAKSGISLSDSTEDSSVLRSTIDRAKKISGGAKVGTAGVSAKVSMELEKSEEHDVFDRPAEIQTREVLDFVYTYLEKYDYRIWICLDQLDQAFVRLSKVEKRALHALISESLFFNRDKMKLKIFLREDIFELITQYRGIVNSDHLRISDSLRWEEVDLLRLILKRILHNNELRGFFHGTIKDLEDINDLPLDKCLFIFYVLFPLKAKKGADTWSYLLRELRDGKGQVTPRDFISFIDHARVAQIKVLSAGDPSDKMFSAQAIEVALEKCSESKVVHYVLAEFPYVADQVNRLRYQRNKYDESQLQEVLGKNGFKTRLKQLLSVGVLQRRGEGATIWIAPIYQRGLKVTQRRAKREKRVSEPVE